MSKNQNKPKDRPLTDAQKRQITAKQMEQYKSQSEIIQWARRNPVAAVKYFFNIQLLDYQAYIFTRAWNAQNVLILLSRNGSKSFLAGLYIMLRTLLFPNYQTYIMSGTAAQSQDTFRKIESIVKNEVSSLKGGNEVYANELVKSTANRDGFLHNPASHQYRLYNGSKVNTLASDEDSIRGKRSNLNWYDESAFMTANYINVTSKFLSQNSGFSTGGDVPNDLKASPFINQQIFSSSAGSTDSEFYRMYRLFSKKMLMGDPNYVVFDLDVNIPLHPTVGGKPFTPLLEQSQVDNDLLQNKAKALREYFNQFDTDGGDSQPIKRADIIKNSKSYLPIFANETGNQLFGIAYDPARNYDNSVVLVGLFYEDKDRGWCMDIVNCVSFVDVAKKKKTPMRTPEQVELTKKMIVDYNGKGHPDYENIKAIGIDSGAGGAGRTIADYFMEDWIGEDGKTHKGIIDKIENADYVSKFPNAVDCMKLLSPAKMKKEMFDNFIELLHLGVISFPEEYDGKGYITMTREIKNKSFDPNKKIDDENCEFLTETYKVNLSLDQEVALKNIDLAKEESVHIQRYDSQNSGYTYRLEPSCVNTLHDDKMYCLAILGWMLMQLRKGTIYNKQKDEIDYSSYINQLVSKFNY